MIEELWVRATIDVTLLSMVRQIPFQLLLDASSIVLGIRNCLPPVVWAYSPSKCTLARVSGIRVSRLRISDGCK